MNASEFWASLEPFSTLLWIVAYILGAIILRWLLLIAIRRFVAGVVSGVKRKAGVDRTQEIGTVPASPLSTIRTVQRTRTLGSILANVVTVAIFIVAVVLIIARVDPNILQSLTLITAALGAGLGFGAQNIIKDVLNGIFMVAEDQLGIGDTVDVGEVTGVVENVGIRVTQIRDVRGVLWYVRNGELLRIGNMSQGWSRAVVDIAIPYAVDVPKVRALVHEQADAVAERTEFSPYVLEKPEEWGIESLSVEALVLRVVVKVMPGKQFDLQRALREAIVMRLESEGIRLPSVQQVVDGTAARGATADATDAESPDGVK